MWVINKKELFYLREIKIQIGTELFLIGFQAIQNRPYFEKTKTTKTNSQSSIFSSIFRLNTNNIMRTFLILSFLSSKLNSFRIFFSLFLMVLFISCSKFLAVSYALHSDTLSRKDQPDPTISSPKYLRRMTTRPIHSRSNTRTRMKRKAAPFYNE